VSLDQLYGHQLESVAASVTGNFTEDHAGCAKVNPGNSCAVYVTYPEQSAGARGSLLTAALAAPLPATNTPAAAPPFRRLTRGVVLNGNNLVLAIRCQHLVPLRPGRLYFLSLVLVRGT